MGENVYPAIFLSLVNDYIETAAIFITWAKVYSTKVAGLGEVLYVKF